MDFSSKQLLEDKKYIYAADFIELIAFSTKANIKIMRIASYLIDANFDQQVTSYFFNKGKSYSKDLHKENSGFDLNTREFLVQCDTIKYATTKYFLDSEEDDLEDDFYYLIDELKSIECIKNLDIDFDRNVMMQAHEASRDWNDIILKPIYKVLEGEFNTPEARYDFLLHLIKRDNFSIMQAACLVAGNGTFEIEKYQNHFRFTEVFSEYISYKLMLELAVKNDELQLNDGCILSNDLQEYLFKNGYIIKGFNEWLTIEPAKPLNGHKSNQQLKADSDKLAEAQAKIAELESELDQVKIQLSEQTQTPQRTRAQTDETNTDKKLIAMLAILLAKQSNAFRISDRPNATQINEQVINLTMQIVDELGMNETDTLGLKANTDKISKAVQAYADMFKLSKD